VRLAKRNRTHENLCSSDYASLIGALNYFQDNIDRLDILQKLYQTIQKRGLTRLFKKYRFPPIFPRQIWRIKMKYATAKASPVAAPEVVLNLWAYVDEAGYILRLAGKSYVMEGDDDEKLAVLRALSRTDFLSAAWCKVPPNFEILEPNGQRITGVATASMLSDPISHSHLFSTLLQDLANSLPDQLRSHDGGYEQFRLNLPQDPLCVTTVVMEYDDGSLVPMVSGR